MPPRYFDIPHFLQNINTWPQVLLGRPQVLLLLLIDPERMRKVVPQSAVGLFLEVLFLYALYSGHQPSALEGGEIGLLQRLLLGTQSCEYRTNHQ